MDGAVFPPCCLTWGQTMVEVMKIMGTSFKRSHAHNAVLSAPDPAAGHRWPMPLPETPDLFQRCQRPPRGLSHVWMWELDYKESWALKNWCFWTVVLEKTLECPLDCKEIKPVHPKGDQSWIFIKRTDAETPILWPPDSNNWLSRKDPDSGKDWSQEEKGMTEDKIVGWHHWLNGHKYE